MNKKIFIDTCRLMGNYNGMNIYLYTSPKYDLPRLFIIINIIVYLLGWIQNNLLLIKL